MIRDDDHLEDALATARRAAVAGGAVLRHYFERNVTAREKRGADLVTEADLAAEATVLAVLRAARPDLGIVSEEAGASRNGAEYVWVVDPLDGTNNLVAGIPQIGVSIALLHGGETELAVVYQPMTERLWFAQRGAGAYRDGERIRAAQPIDPSRAVVAWVQGYPVGDDVAAPLQAALRGRIKRLLTNWAPALDWCLLAEGRIHGLLSLDSEREDQLAGTLIAQEAGAIVTDLQGHPYAADTTRILAAGDAMVHARLRELLGGG